MASVNLRPDFSQGYRHPYGSLPNVFAAFLVQLAHLHYVNHQVTILNFTQSGQRLFVRCAYSEMQVNELMLFMISITKCPLSKKSLKLT